ncbi:MAG: hypothetical protein FWG73_03435 [Planctomycetaceae bacterium]|nr:hypothetical protein [Planctomycetaceae bacterium]
MPSFSETGLETEPVLPFDIPDGQTLLRYQFKKGEELHWNVQHTLKMRNIIGGMEENIETRSRAVKIWKTLDVDANGAATFEYRVEDIDMHQAQTGHDDILYNSCRDKQIPAEFSNLQGKIGVPLAHIKIEPQGQTTRKPIREYAGSISENRIVIPLPDEPVGTGSRWSEPNQIELPQSNRTVKKIRARDEFALESIHSGLATIRFSTLIFTPLTPQEESQLLDHFMQGTMELDLQAGYFIRHQATADRLVVGIQDASDSIRYLSRTTSCCCGRRACEICGIA